MIYTMILLTPIVLLVGFTIALVMSCLIASSRADDLMEEMCNKSKKF